MAHYFFDVHSRTRSTIDDDGQDCVDWDAVSRYALQVLCDIARDDPLADRCGQLGAIVRDASGLVVLTATIGLSTIWVGGV